LRTQRVVALISLIAQIGINGTGAIVRVTASGLGCPTWPECHPGSLIPVAGSSEGMHAAVEFGNRLLTFVLVASAIAIVVAVVRARRRFEVLIYAWLIPAGTIIQAIIGGIVVRTGLTWWTVALHLLPSMAMVWLATLLYMKVGMPDEHARIEQRMPEPLRMLTALSAIVLSGALVVGTMVTGAGPHAGDKSVDRTVPRLNVDVLMLVNIHAYFVITYLALLVGLGFGLHAAGVSPKLWKHLWGVVGLVGIQAAIGIVQVALHVPAGLVWIHVLVAALCVCATATLWESGRVQVPIDSKSDE
jgi:cytochrome c oxidase assembly protein subunit 15